MRDNKQELYAVAGTPRGPKDCFRFVGGDRSGVVSLLCMMDWWCDGLKTVPHYPKQTLFTNLYHLLFATILLNVPRLVAEVVGDGLRDANFIIIPEKTDLEAAYVGCESGL